MRLFLRNIEHQHQVRSLFLSHRRANRLHIGTIELDPLPIMSQTFKAGEQLTNSRHPSNQSAIVRVSLKKRIEFCRIGAKLKLLRLRIKPPKMKTDLDIHFMMVLLSQQDFRIMVISWLGQLRYVLFPNCHSMSQLSFHVPIVILCPNCYSISQLYVP